jgi:prepilin-type N-terminal cleavage/methylation domain-containing protein
MKGSAANGGYSLLEVMITLAVLALAASVVMPGLSSGMESASIRSARLQAESSVMAMRRLAIRNDQTIEIRSALNPIGNRADAGEQADLAMRLDLPDGWSYVLSGPVLVNPDGTCELADLDLLRDSGSPILLRISNACSLITRIAR